MVRTATLDLSSRGSFVDDLNSKPGIVIRRDALLHRSNEIQPAFFDSEVKRTFNGSFFFHLFLFTGPGTCLAHFRPRGGAPWGGLGLGVCWDLQLKPKIGRPGASGPRGPQPEVAQR